MRIDGLQVNSSLIIGSVPGVHVGDHFWYWIEMVIVGLHQQLETGIAFIGKNKSSSGMSFATSISTMGIPTWMMRTAISSPTGGKEDSLTDRPLHTVLQIRY